MPKLNLLTVAQAVVEGEQVVMGVIADVSEIQGMTPGGPETEQKIPIPHDVEIALPGGVHFMLTGVTGYRRK